MAIWVTGEGLANFGQLALQRREDKKQGTFKSIPQRKNDNERQRAGDGRFFSFPSRLPHDHHATDVGYKRGRRFTSPCGSPLAWLLGVCVCGISKARGSSTQNIYVCPACMLSLRTCLCPSRRVFFLNACVSCARDRLVL